MYPLVSIITPCYNGEFKIKKFLESILEQTYLNIEFIFINDGSTDKTEKIVLSYQQKLKNKGIKFIYIKQKNSGQAAAINRGLAIFKGKYLLWPDSDDILDKDNIKEEVAYLEKYKNCGLVYCNTNIVHETNLNKVIKRWNRKLDDNKYVLFKDLIISKDIIFAGVWMLRSEFFFTLRPTRVIEEIKGIGQNWQILLPMAYAYPSGKVNKFLFTYVIYNESHSHVRRNYSQMLEELYLKENALKKILGNIDLDKKEYYMQLATDKYALERFDVACLFCHYADVRKFFSFLWDNKIKISCKRKIKYLLTKYHLYKMCRFIKQIITIYKW